MGSRQSSWGVFNHRSHSPTQRRPSCDGGPSCSKRSRTEKGNWAVTGLWPRTTPIMHPPLLNLFSRQPCYLGLWFQVRECTHWDLKPNHLLHSPTPLPVSQPSPLPNIISRNTQPPLLARKGCVWQWTAVYMFVSQMCVCMSMCDCPSVLSVVYMCIDVCESISWEVKIQAAEV